MKRKDCATKTCHDRPGGASLARSFAPSHCASVVITLALFVASAQAAGVRLWSTAVVTTDHVRLGDLCDLQGFDTETETAIRQQVVTAAPLAGGSKLVGLQTIRDALTSANVNLATVRVAGASVCEVTRPSDAPRPTVAASPASVSVITVSTDGPDLASKTPIAPARTLRQAVIDHFNQEASRHRATAEVTFDRVSERALELSGPEYEFRVRRRNGAQLDLLPLQVDVLANGNRMQSVDMLVRVVLQRSVVVATRAINQGATIRASDVELASMSFSRLEANGLDDPSACIGQRAKKFIAAGARIESAMIESVPLVTRGQLVTVTSSIGAVRIVTTGKADEDGLLGAIVKVRGVDSSRTTFEAQVTGPGQVQMGETSTSSSPRLAGRGVR